MQIVIDISDELKNKIDACDDDSYSSIIRWYDTTLYDAIRNGTSLPKGHGDLIDREELFRLASKRLFPNIHIKQVKYIAYNILPTVIEREE